MTIEENNGDLASSWQKYVDSFYYEDLRKSLNLFLKKSKDEGMSDLNCIVVKVPITLDFTHLINYNPEFYEYFSSAGPEELKGLIRESAHGPFQEMISNLDKEVKIDRRQISVEIFMKNLPCSSDVLLDSKGVYQSSIPRLFSDNLNLKSVWDGLSKIIIGKVISLSESIYLCDIKTFSCTNPRCRNNNKVIRHIGFDHVEHIEELGSNKSKPEVFISSSTNFKNSKKLNIKCSSCREEIEELYPFRSVIEFKLAKIKTESSTCFSIDLLLFGSEICSIVKLANEYSFIGYPKLSIEIPFQLKQQLKGLLRPFYFEVYGAEPVRNFLNSIGTIKIALDWLTSSTNEKLRFLLLVILCQVIGSFNGIHLNISLPDIDYQVIIKISKLINLVFKSDTIIGTIGSKIKFSNFSKKVLKVQEEIYPFKVNIIVSNTEVIDNDLSKIFINQVQNGQLIIIPIDMPTNDEVDLLVKEPTRNIPIINVPILSNTIPLSESCVKLLQSHFLNMRFRKTYLPMKFSLGILSKFCQISAINLGKSEADEDDAEFSIMIHKKLLELSTEDVIEVDVLSPDLLMSPCNSFDFGNESNLQSLNDYYGIF